MKEVAAELKTTINERDERQVIEYEALEIHYFPDDRGFAFITCKINNEELIPLIDRYREKFSKN